MAHIVAQSEAGPRGQSDLSTEERDQYPNLVLLYDSDHPIGRTLHRGEDQPEPCSHALVVLKWDGERQYHVLTSYPEC